MHSNRNAARIAAACLLLASTLAGATAQRTFVSSAGVNNASCSLATPCRDFAAAITATSAGGEVIVLDSAGYGPVIITKSVSLIAPAGIYGGISVFSGDGVTVNAPGATVVLRGLSINGQGGSYGVRLQQAAQLRIEGCVISKMAANGILDAATNANMIVHDTIVRDSGGIGIRIAVDAFVVLDQVRSEHNQQDGLYIQAAIAESRAMITDSTFAFNGGNGFNITATGSARTFVQLDRSVVADNGAAGISATPDASADVVLQVTRNAIHRNTVAGIDLAGPGRVVATVSQNAFVHNTTGISADGIDVFVYVSANSLVRDFVGLSDDFLRANNASFFTYGNNIGPITKNGTITSTVGE